MAAIGAGGQPVRAAAAGHGARPYVLAGDDADLRRLLRISEALAGPCREALARTGIRPGWRVLECGCGPLGALAVLSELVGAGGRVVGVDLNREAIDQARAVVSRLGLANVEVVAGDVHDLTTAGLGDRVDLVYTRCFLMHQRDPIETLRKIGSVLRPGGWVVCQEPLREPAPWSHPQLDSLAIAWRMLHELLAKVGVPPTAVASIPALAGQAGLSVQHAGGFYTVFGPEVGFELHAATLAAVRKRMVQTGGVDRDEVNELIEDLRAARGQAYEWVTSPIYLDLALSNR
jgi:SAM-dependent methyltransferase